MSLPLTGAAMPFSVALASPLLLSTAFGFDASTRLMAAGAAATVTGAAAATLFSIGREEEEESFDLFSSVAGLSSSLSLSLRRNRTKKK